MDLGSVVSFPAGLPPFAIGFFGLGTGYLIYGPQELFGFPARDPSVNRATGWWGIWMPGFCQFVAGSYLFVGIAWFHTFPAAYYAAALAFSAYGIHWFAIGINRLQGNDSRPNAFMAIAFLLISILGMLAFGASNVDDIPVVLLFAGLTCIYASDIFASLKNPMGEKALGFFHLLTGTWLMYLTFAATLNLGVGDHFWL
ncbi:MAG: hypothetical protein ACRENY_03245 [Candidatus Dormibacteria bacterium]